MKKWKLIWLGLRIFLLDWWSDRWERYIYRRFCKTHTLSERRVLCVYQRFLLPARNRQNVLMDRFNELKEKILQEMESDAGT